MDARAGGCGPAAASRGDQGHDDRDRALGESEEVTDSGDGADHVRDDGEDGGTSAEVGTPPGLGSLGQR